MIDLTQTLNVAMLTGSLDEFWAISAAKIDQIEGDSSEGVPVFTVDGRYTTQDWTQWTQGFQFGSMLLQYEATGDEKYLDWGRTGTLQQMPAHVTHFGVHDHGFNNISTYGALRRMMLEGRLDRNEWELHYYEMALSCSAAVQAYRWSETSTGDGYIYSFNGPHSLFCDTIRSLRSLALGHTLGHELLIENDERVSLLDRLIQHAQSTARHNVYYGEGRDTYDVLGRVAHESIFNTRDGRYRCPSTQQGYSPFTTWTRGLAWIMLGFPEQLEYLQTVDDQDFAVHGGRAAVEACFLKAARAACDFYIHNTPTDGIPFWDTGAPGLTQLGDYLDRPADPLNDHEPIDSSAAAIAAQGLLRLGHYLNCHGEDGSTYFQAGLKTAQTLLGEPYLNKPSEHQGLLLHSIYHQPRGWDAIASGARIPHGESCMWGDYHLRELALYLGRLAGDAPYYTFFGSSPD